MKNLILGIVVLVVLGACSSEPKEEVGRYVPIPPSSNTTELQVLDTKTGLVYATLSKENKIYFVQINPIKPQVKGAKILFNPGILDTKGANYE
jgi:hypothetical protein